MNTNLLPHKEFLRESNAIEDVWDEDSLQQSLYAWDYLNEEKSLTRGAVLKTHKILMLHQRLRPDEKGYFRKCAVWIGGREGKPWYAVPDLVSQWVDEVNHHITMAKAGTITQEEFAAMCQEDHVQYEKIHPFVDGNGRTGRIFLNYERIQGGLPILVVKEAEKFAYYDWFR